MANVKAGFEYKINYNNNSFLLDEKKFKLLECILDTKSITHASKAIGVSYRTALNYIEKIESNLDIKIVNTNKGGKGGGGGATLSKEGYNILKECKKINAIMNLHQESNEIISTIEKIDEDKGVMYIQFGKNDIIKIPLNRNYKVNEEIVALISYDNIFLMLEPIKSSIRNYFKGKIVELKLYEEIVRVKIEKDEISIFCDITISAMKELDLNIGNEIYFAFKAMSVATLKL